MEAQAMTKSQNISLKISEKRQRLNEIAGMETDKITDDIKAEQAELAKEFSNLETQYRAALQSETTETEKAKAEAGGDTTDGEAKERRALLDKVSISDYLTPAASCSPLNGAPKELADALGVPTMGAKGGVAVPFELLETQYRAANTEKRAAAPTTTANVSGGSEQRPILQRLFGRGILDALGVRLDAVPVGRSDWPLLTGGVAPKQKAEGAAADDAIAATFTTKTLRPKRLTGVYEYTHEVAAQVQGLEEALRIDLRDAITAKMSELILTGASDDEPKGFLSKLAAPAKPTKVAVYADYASSHATAVDGIHAHAETEVSSIVGVATYKHAAQVFNQRQSESAAEAMARRSFMCASSSFIPAPASDIQDAIYHAGMDTMRGDSIAAVWPTIELIRDPYSKASSGVVLTWAMLWDAETAFRTEAYHRAAFKLA